MERATADPRASWRADSHAARPHAHRRRRQQRVERGARLKPAPTSAAAIPSSRRMAVPSEWFRRSILVRDTSSLGEHDPVLARATDDWRSVCGSAAASSQRRCHHRNHSSGHTDTHTHTQTRSRATPSRRLRGRCARRQILTHPARGDARALARTYLVRDPDDRDDAPAATRRGARVCQDSGRGRLRRLTVTRRC